ncbi:alanine--glyoxylate aminotransferase 2-like protein, partial [Lasius niger]
CQSNLEQNSTMESLEQMPKSDTIRLRDRHIGQSCKLFYKSNPLKIVRAEGQYMYDEKGNRYLDCINNVAHELYALHVPPEMKIPSKVNETNMKRTSIRLSTLNRQGRRASMNTEIERIQQIRTNRMWTSDSFHHGGNRIHRHKDLVAVLGGAPCPDVYRGKYRSIDYVGEDLGVKYAEDVKQICDDIKAEGRGVCAYIAESLISVGGQILPPQNYFRNAYKHVREAGGVCIADEVQVGFGRVGTHMWAFQLYGEDVVPDIVTMGKPMGNGHPVAAVITTPEIARSFRDTGIEYFNTYGGNPVSCAMANAVMEVIERENLQENALKVGNHLIAELKKLAKRRKIIGDVRGAGLFVGIELVRDRIKRIPATAEAKHVVSRMKEKKILVSNDGPDNNVLKLKPPMVFSIENVNHFVSVLDEVLEEVDIDFDEEPEITTTIIKATISSIEVDTTTSVNSGNSLFVRAN